MAKKPIPIRKVHEFLRLHFEQNISARKAAQIVRIDKTSANQYIARFKFSGLEHLSISCLLDTEMLKISKLTQNNIELKNL